MEKASKLKKQLQNIDSLQNRLESEIDKLKKMMAPFCDFTDGFKVESQDEIDWSIFYQPSDYCFVLEVESFNAPLSRCLNIIESKGKLTFADYENFTI